MEYYYYPHFIDLEAKVPKDQAPLWKSQIQAWNAVMYSEFHILFLYNSALLKAYTLA